MTYSIVARDEDTGELGVAVQTCYFAVGSVVPWAVPGVGAVATQATSEPAYGTWCLDALARGLEPTDALSEAAANDASVAHRQVGVVSASGGAASMTGDLCIDYAGHLIGDGFAVQANMMSNPSVWEAMASTYVSSSGSLARRLLATLEAGQRAGGDARGQMAAALLVVSGERQPTPGGGKVVDIRVEHSPEPLVELARVLRVAEGFALYNQAYDTLVAGDIEGARARNDEALALVPGDENMRFLQAGLLLFSGDLDGGLRELRALLAERPSWGTIVRSLANQGVFALPDGLSLDDLVD